MLSTRQELATLKTEPSNPICVAFSPDGKTLASAGTDGVLTLWDVSTRQAVVTLKGHSIYDVNSVAFSPDGKTLASAGNDGTVRLWDTAAQQQLAVLQ